MSPARVKVKLAGKTIEVPVYGDSQLTQRLAARVNARIKEIEERAGRIDTQAFALEAALAFAAELQQLQNESEADRKTIYAELDRISKTVDKLAREFRKTNP
jgi:cell division protein ZapA (FtsZ GTPase activity inhibitor)